MPPPRLIATDLDGTLLRDDLTPSPRTLEALRRAREAGVLVVPVTARQPWGLREIADDCGFQAWALCGNGALGLRLDTNEPLFEARLDAVVQQEIGRRLGELAPGVLFASVREGGKVFLAQEGYAAVADFSDHKRDPATMGGHPLSAVLKGASLKLIVRHPEIAAPELMARLIGLGVDGCTITHSGAPFVEILGAGVDKSWGLARLCDHLGIAREEVVAFGDAPNDVEMLSWAGHGVAVANACPEALAAADEVTASNQDDGVALVLERLLDAPAVGTSDRVEPPLGGPSVP